MGTASETAGRKRLLLLAGTAEARRLAGLLAGLDEIETIASLVGATAAPARYRAAARVGGFGGADALADWLRAERIAAIVDATHPFAERISANAAAAAAETRTPLLRLDRPPWREREGERWRRAASAAEAAALPPSGAAVFLAAGKGALAPFLARGDLKLTLRVVDAPPPPAPGLRALYGRPPFPEAAERATFADCGAEWLICKNSGGEAGRSKLDAARALGLEVAMIDRPPPPPGVARVETVEAALRWARETLGGPPYGSRTSTQTSR